MKNDGFDFKAMFARKGMSIAPLQDKDIIVYALLISGCEVRQYQLFSPEAQTAAWNKDSKSNGENGVNNQKGPF